MLPNKIAAKFSFNGNTVCKLIYHGINASVTFFLSLMPLKKWRKKLKTRHLVWIGTDSISLHLIYWSINSQQRRKLSQPVEGSSTPVAIFEHLY